MVLTPLSKKSEQNVSEADILSFWDREAHNLGERTREVISDNWWMEKKLRKMFPDKKSLRIADIGTGAGYLAVNYAKMGYDVVATDISSKMLEEARITASEEGVDVEFVQDDIQHTRLEKGSFDLVELRDVVFTLMDVEDAILCAIDLVRPGGIIDIVDGNYFLYLNDEDYQKREDYYRLKNKTEEYRLMTNMTLERFRELEGLMKELDVNKHCRPYKEMEILARHGMNKISMVCGDYEDIGILTEHGWERLPFRYTVFAQKPSEEPVNDPRNPISVNNEVLRQESSNHSVSKVFEMLSNPDRISILRCLDREPCCVRTISERTGISEKMTSYHMVQLREAGLVAYERVGREVVYHNTDSNAVSHLLLAASSFSAN